MKKGIKAVLVIAFMLALTSGFLFAQSASESKDSSSQVSEISPQRHRKFTMCRNINLLPFRPAQLMTDLRID